MNTRTRYLNWWDKLGRVAVLTLWVVFYLALYGCDVPGASSDQEVAERKARVQVRTAAAQKTEPERPIASAREERPVEEPTPPAAVEPVSFENAYDVFQQNQFEEAGGLFARYVEDHPANSWGYYMLGLSRWKAGHLLEAEQAFEEVLARDPSHIKSLINLTRVLLDAGRSTEALEQVDAALDIDPHSGDGLRLLGRALYAQGDVDGAIDAYEEAVTVNDEDAWAMNNLGLILIREERFEDALLPLARATRLRNDVAVFYNNLGIALERTGHFQAAAEAYGQAIASADGNDKALVSLARVEQRADDVATVPVDLDVLAQQFVTEINQRRNISVPTAVAEPAGHDSVSVTTTVVEPIGGDSIPVDSTATKTKKPENGLPAG